MKMVLLLTSILITINLFAVDPHNTYQWNRGNELRGNSKVDRKPWFEWWYYKVVDPKTNRSFYFVYGVVNPWDKKHVNFASRAYVGMGDFKNKVNFDEIFSVNDFSASYDSVEVDVAGNIATDKSIVGDITSEEGNKASWNISIEKRWSFDAISWATGRNVTNIEWYPAQADARCTGEVTTNGETYKFEDAPCYQDRNWGTSFPKWWTWIVSNSFVDSPDTAIAIGGGRPVILGRFEPIEGVAIGLNYKGKEYKFRPNEFDKVTIDINFGKWECVGEGLYNKIEVSAWAPKEDFMDLQFMTPQGEVFHDYETLTGKLTVKLYERKIPFISEWELITELKSNHAGIEYGSNEVYESVDIFSTSRRLF